MITAPLVIDTAQIASELLQTLEKWRSSVGASALLTSHYQAFSRFLQTNSVCLAPPVSQTAIEAWEEAHCFQLPESLKHWLRLSNGLYVNHSHWIHPLRSIGPTVRFTSSERLLQQPLSWYEFGNPNDWPVNIDLITVNHDQNSDASIFVTSDETGPAQPRIIAKSFKDWFLKLMDNTFCHEFSSVFHENLGDPISEHYRNIKPPKLQPELCMKCKSVGELLLGGKDERQVMKLFNLNRDELEQVINAFQYRREKSSRHF
jgi:hypothetical protein